MPLTAAGHGGTLITYPGAYCVLGEDSVSREHRGQEVWKSSTAFKFRSHRTLSGILVTMLRSAALDKCVNQWPHCPHPQTRTSAPAL